ncbi:hypothetical protein MLD38_000259 [Melastoma candidum]|uniref:Uncharacterized protein n=1 Tax=Melastoma candidum TaxID=119954 RepID=A0ACB9S998_9MYRT|nr:hypothetical protein MLD38_000259 [Melastoma candidum]
MNPTGSRIFSHTSSTSPAVAPWFVQTAGGLSGYGFEIIDLVGFCFQVLDALEKIKAEDDSTLSYRRSCREGICGSCSMNMDGTNTVACLKPIDPDTRRATMITHCRTCLLSRTFWSTSPTSSTNTGPSSHGLRRDNHPRMDGNIVRAPEDRKKLDGLYECILCACCSGARPSYWWNPEEFLGPAPVIHAYRWISDSRDEYAEERLRAMTDDMRKLYWCRTIKNCTWTCPKSLDLAGAIHKMKARHLLSSPV